MTNMAHSSIKSNWNAYRYFKIGRNAAIRNRADWSTLGKKNRRSFVTGPHTNTPTHRGISPQKKEKCGIAFTFRIRRLLNFFRYHIVRSQLGNPRQHFRLVLPEISRSPKNPFYLTILKAVIGIAIIHSHPDESAEKTISDSHNDPPAYFPGANLGQHFVVNLYL